MYKHGFAVHCNLSALRTDVLVQFARACQNSIVKDYCLQLHISAYTWSTQPGIKNIYAVHHGFVCICRVSIAVAQVFASYLHPFCCKQAGVCAAAICAGLAASPTSVIPLTHSQHPHHCCCLAPSQPQSQASGTEPACAHDMILVGLPVSVCLLRVNVTLHPLTCMSRTEVMQTSWFTCYL